MNLETFAENELRKAGLFDADSDYGGMIGESVMKLVRALSGEGHSGGSAAITLAAFERISRWRPLTPLTPSPDEWMEVAENLWQSTRQPSCFSMDGGKTHYDIDADDNRAIRVTGEP